MQHEAKPNISVAIEMKKWIKSPEKYDNLMLGLRLVGFIFCTIGIDKTSQTMVRKVRFIRV